MHTLRILSPTDTATSNATIDYGHIRTPFGLCLFASLQDRLCWASFADHANTPLAGIQAYWRGSLKENIALARRWSQKVLEHLQTGKNSLNLLLIGGTPFQQAVWQALLTIPRGKTLSYQAIATAIQNPKAVRAVGQAVGRNPLAIIIPCHRVIRKSGALGGFAYGLDFKKRLLAIEHNA